MLIFDVFRGQVTDRITKFIEENDCVIVHVPRNMTDHFQPLDLNVNGNAKEFLKTKFECWYSKQVSDQIDHGIIVYDVHVPLKLSVIKPIHAKWLLGLYDHLRNSSSTIMKGFEMAGIRDALVMELPPEDPFADLDSSNVLRHFCETLLQSFVYFLVRTTGFVSKVFKFPVYFVKSKKDCFAASTI